MLQQCIFHFVVSLLEKLLENGPNQTHHEKMVETYCLTISIIAFILLIIICALCAYVKFLREDRNDLRYALSVAYSILHTFCTEALNFAFVLLRIGTEIKNRN